MKKDYNLDEIDIENEMDKKVREKDHEKNTAKQSGSVNISLHKQEEYKHCPINFQKTVLTYF